MQGQQDGVLLRIVVVAAPPARFFEPERFIKGPGRVIGRPDLQPGHLGSLGPGLVQGLDEQVPGDAPAPVSGASAHLYEDVNLGFTIQADATLYLAVVKGAQRLDAQAFVRELSALQLGAMRHSLTPEQTSDATVSFSSMARWNVTRHMPVLPPQTSLIVAHTATAGGRAQLGATYDHRLLTGFEVVKVPMEAGDLLIFNSTQPHGIRANTSGNKVRMAQYISMMPAEEDNEALREWRISSWRERRALYPGNLIPSPSWIEYHSLTADTVDLGGPYDQ